MLKINANSKINLFLEITGKRADGYHTVDTVMQSVSLTDELALELIPRGRGIRLTCNIPAIPTDERNIAYKTAKAYLDVTGIDCGVSININKVIPSEAGMGGGSADGAAVLLGLNALCGTILDLKDLEVLAAKHGADIPFCIGGGTKRLTGIGTETTEVYTSPVLPLVIAKPDHGVSTPQAYRYLDKLFSDFTDHCPESPRRLIEILKGNAVGYADSIYNRFEYVLGELCPESRKLIDYLRDHSHGSLLCGSGAAVFAIADSVSHADSLAKSVRDEFGCSVWTAATDSCGCRII